MVTLQFDQPCPLLVVMVNYRTAGLAVQCLRSLAPEIATLPGMKVAIVDNNSADGSVETIAQAIAQEHWEDWAILMPSSHNGGFAYGNNYAIRPALEAPNAPPYYLLLNPDTEMLSGSLKSLVSFMDEHPKVGIAGSSLQDEEGNLWPYAFRFPSILSELERGMRLGFVSKLLEKWAVPQKMSQEPQPIDWLPGASMMIRREVFDAIGLMDEEYFLYYEETDFCLQAKRAGWPCWYVPESRVMHMAGQSTGVSSHDLSPKRLPQYVFDSRRRYFVKNHGILYATLADLAWSVGFASWRLRRVLQRKPDTDPPYLLWDSLRNSVLVKGGLQQAQL